MTVEREAVLDRALEVEPGWAMVPGNRYDLLPAGPAPSVTVVVPHFEQPRQLARALSAVARQTHGHVEVVVADDGSARAPSVPPGVRLVRQPDLGNRAGAARNLGAATSRADVLVFLDADTAPEPGFVAALVRRAAACPDVLAVGRRRYVDWSGDGAELPEPAWLADGYTATRDLLDADGGSFRYVISAVMAFRRTLFEDLGGFDERYVGYGGEDWDLAYRAWNAGAVLEHEPDAVAWHDGPDWSGRIGETGKDQETERLAAVIPEPALRGVPLPALFPDVLVDVPAGDPRAAVAVLRQDHRDLQVRVDGPPGVLLEGSVRTAPWTDEQRRRARVAVRLTESVPLAPDAVGRAVYLLTEGGLGQVALRARGHVVGIATATRAAGRARRWAGRVDGVVDLAFGRAALDVDLVPGRDDLEGFLALPWR